MSLSLDALLSRLATVKLPKPGGRLELEPLAGSADALAIAQLASRGRMLVVITANPLDAQRDACEAYIASQKSEGWVALPDAYNDGGFSGGTLNRPGVQQ